MSTVNKMLEAITPEVYERFKTAIAIRKWPDGRALTKEQVATCMQAVIAYEAKHVAPEERTGYVPPKTTPCEDKPEQDDDKPLKWQ